MKRLDPTTGLPFKFGTRREDGFLFKGYSTKIAKRTGFFYESWVSEEAFEKVKRRKDKSARKFTANNRERVREIQRKHEKNNRAKRTAKNAKYFAAKDLRTPSWLTQKDISAIREFYILAAEKTKETGMIWHVDHIVPLRGELVSGLHVPWNLQIMPGKENYTKRNHFDPGAYLAPELGTYS